MTKTILGKPVIDAKKSVKFEVTDDDCRRGVRKNTTCCAAQVALLRKEGVKAARVSSSRIYLEMEDHWLRYFPSPALKREIVSFDRGGIFAPGEYSARRVSPSDMAGVRPKRSINKSKRKSHQSKGLKSTKIVGIRPRFSLAKAM